MFVLDTCTLSWSKPEVSGDAPVARAGHGAITYGQYMLVMLGKKENDTRFYFVFTLCIRIQRYSPVPRPKVSKFDKQCWNSRHEIMEMGRQDLTPRRS